jgi:hypothetical protein
MSWETNLSSQSVTTPSALILMIVFRIVPSPPVSIFSLQRSQVNEEPEKAFFSSTQEWSRGMSRRTAQPAGFPASHDS